MQAHGRIMSPTPMKLTNDSYLILLRGRNCAERYYRDSQGWVKISARGRKFRMTAEQALNHLLPAFAGVKPGLTIEVIHRDSSVSRNSKRRMGRVGPKLK